MIEQAFENAPDSPERADLIDCLEIVHQRILDAETAGAITPGDRARHIAAVESLAEQIAASMAGVPVPGGRDERCPRCKVRMANPPSPGKVGFCRVCGAWAEWAGERLIEFQPQTRDRRR